jgi:hypothetical protein
MVRQSSTPFVSFDIHPMLFFSNENFLIYFPKCDFLYIINRPYEEKEMKTFGNLKNDEPSDRYDVT